MTANAYYTWAYIFQAIVAICSIGFFVEKLTSSKKKIAGGVVIICLAASVCLNYKGKEKDRSDSKLSETQSNKRYDSVCIELKKVSYSLGTLTNSMQDIKTALKEGNLVYDSIDKKITTIAVKDNSGIIMTNPIFHAPTMVGGKNDKQTNNGK